MSSKFLLLSILIASLCSLSFGQRLTEDCLKKAGILRDSKEDSIFQKVAGLRRSDDLNNQTLQKMKEMRCGVKDFDLMKYHNGKYYPNIRSKIWKKKNLTWSLRNFAKHTNMTKDRELEIIRNAFRVWEENNILKFKEVNGTADIKLSFETGNHGDNLNFDSLHSNLRKILNYRSNPTQHNTMAHAFIPPDGRVHFNNDLNWTESFRNGVNLEYVAIHQIGHALGFSHFGYTDRVMSPFYPKTRPKFKLSKSDVDKIRLYYQRFFSSMKEHQSQ